MPENPLEVKQASWFKVIGEEEYKSHVWLFLSLIVYLESTIARKLLNGMDS